MKKIFFAWLVIVLGLYNTANSQTIIDTITYPIDNASGFDLINFSGVTTDIGQFFSVNGTVQVTGVQIAFGAKRQVGTSDTYNIRLFNVGADSLPTGAALATRTFTTSAVDTAAIFNTFTFATPTNVTNRFAIVVEVAATTKNDTNVVFTSANGDGLGLRRSLVRTNADAAFWGAGNTNVWFKLQDALFFPGTTDNFDADFLIFPIYQFQQNPFAQFSATPLTANIGQTVTFSNSSSGTPTPTYNWAISPNTFAYTGGTTATSVNPQVQFSAAGTYSVTLTASNSNGNDTEIKNSYITVLGGGGGTPSNCDTLFNFGFDDTLRVFNATPGGYQAGHNGYGDISKAEFFDNPYGSAQLNRAFFYFGVAKAANANKTINIRVWNNTGLDGDGIAGAPGNVLFTQTVTIQSLPTQGNVFTYTFPTPITVTTDFFVGINFAYAAGDTVALFLNNDLETFPGTAWEQFGTGEWYNYNNIATWGTEQSHFILADLCQSCPTINATTANLTANTSCTTPNGSFNVNASGGTGPYQYSRTANVFQPSNAFTGLQGGNYTITVRDANGCTGTVSVTVTATASTPATSLSNIVPNTSCASPFNGGFTGNISGGVAPYTFSISGPNGFSQNGTAPFAGSVPYTGLEAGTYNGTVTGSNGCSATTSAVIPNNAASILVTQQSVTPRTSCSTNNGALTVVATGGTAPYAYSIPGSNNQTGTFTGLAAATYTVTAVASSGCSGTVSVTVANNTPVINASLNNIVANTSCSAANGSVTINVTGGASPYNYALSNGAQGALNPNPLTVGSLAAATYTVTVTDANGCSGTGSGTVANNAPSVTVTQNSVTPSTACGTGNGALTVTGSNGVSPYTYSISGGSNQTGTFSSLAGGTYVVTVVASNGCSGTLSVSVPNNAPTLNLQVTGSNPNTSCTSPNGSLTVSATGGTAQYSYNNGSSVNQTGSFNNLSAGNLTITATDANGCTGTVAANVANQATAPVPAVQSNNANTACSSPFNGSFTLSASGGSAPYTYATASATNQTGSFTALSAGAYIVTVSGSNGCSTTTTVNVANTPASLTLQVANNTSNTSCTTPNGTFTVTTSGGAGPFNYSIGGASNQTGTFAGLNGGTFNVTVTDGSGCTGTASVSVTNNQASLTLNASSTAATSNSTPDGSATVSATGGSVPYTYLWSNGSTTQNINGLVAGVYNVTVTDNNGCTASASVSVSLAVGIADNYAMQLDIFPNPTKNNLNVNIVLAKAENITIELFNILGENIVTQNIGNSRIANHTIGMENFANGVYVVKVAYGEKTNVRRIVLNK